MRDRQDFDVIHNFKILNELAKFLNHVLDPFLAKFSNTRKSSAVKQSTLVYMT